MEPLLVWRILTRALSGQGQFEAGSQLIAHFDQDLDATDLRTTMEGLLIDAMTNGSDVRVEIARGYSTVVYITFVTFKEAAQTGVTKLLGELAMKGAVLTHCPGFGHQTGVLNLQVEGSSLYIFHPFE